MGGVDGFMGCSFHWDTQLRRSPAQIVRQIVKALEDAGIILGYRALVDAKKVELGLIALIQISMDKHTQERFSSFEREIKAIPEVLECLLITGHSADYLLKVIVKDLEHYQKLLLQKITKIAGVTGVHSSFVLNKVIDKTALPIY